MSDDLILPPTGNSSLPNKQCEFNAAVNRFDNRSDVKEIKVASEDGERTRRKRELLIKRKDVERLNRIHLRRAGGSLEGNSTKVQKQEAGHSRQSASAIQSQEEVAEMPKSKNSKKNVDDVVNTSRFKRKAKEVEKPPDSKPSPPAEKTKKTGSKTKAVTAFGTTFHKSEPDEPPLRKRKPLSSVDRLGRSKRSKSKDAITEEETDELRRDSSQSPLRPSTKLSSLKMSLSKNKLTEMLEEVDKDRTKLKGTYESATGKRARSPYHASSKIDFKKPTSRSRMEGDSRHTGIGKQEEKGEMGKDLSFLEKIQQNVRAYFSPKTSSEIAKFEEEEKKVPEGEHPVNDESIMIWKDERIKNGFKEDFMKGDQNFFLCIENEKKSSLDVSCKTITREYIPGQKSARGNGSGPGGKIAYSNGDICNPITDYRYKRLYYIKRRNECTEKPRTGSFHRSKTFQKNALAPSAPKPSTSISLILEPDEQVENVSSADGMASAFTQIQELHQEISPNVMKRRMNYVRGTRSLILQDDNQRLNANYLPDETADEWMKGYAKPEKRHRSRVKRMRHRGKRNVAVAECSPESNTNLRGYGMNIGNRVRSEETVRSCPYAHSVILHKGIHYQTLPNEKSQSSVGREKTLSFIPIQRQWLVYSVTEAKPIQTARRKSPSAESELSNAHDFATRTECTKSMPVPKRSPEPGKNAEEESPSVTLKDIINLSHRVFLESPGKSAESPDSGPSPSLRKDNVGSFTLSHCLEKLMQEKKNYLNLEKTKSFRKAQKANFISDSFNFFNLLNEEFLSLKSSNPRIEELRDAIAQKEVPEMEDYLDLYKRVIRTSLTEPEQFLMDKAKQELERYTDMYYDLMKFICLEKEGNDKTPLSRDKSSEKSRGKSNYEHILKPKVTKNIKTWDKYSDKTKRSIEKPYYATKVQEYRRNRDWNIGRSSHKINNFKRNGGVAGVHAKDQNVQDSKIKPVVELLSPHKKKETEQGAKGREKPVAEKEDPSSEGKVYLSISLCDDGLFIKHVKDDSDEENKEMPFPFLNDEKRESLDAEPLSEEIEVSQSEQVKADSDATVYPKSSIDEDDSSGYQVEQSVLKFKAFRKLLSEGLNNITLPNATEGEDKQRERREGRLKQEPEFLSMSHKSSGKEKKRYTDYPKSIKRHKCVVDSPVYSMHEERTKKHLYKKRSGSVNKKEDTQRKVPWWRKDPAAADAGTSKSRKSYQTRKVENSKSVKTSLSQTKATGSREGKKTAKTETKEAAEKEITESVSEFKTPPGSYLEWRFGVKNMEELLYDIPPKMLNPGGLSEGKLLHPYEEKEEKELHKMDLSGGDEKGADSSEKQLPSPRSGQKTSLKLGFHDPLKAEWAETSMQKDYQKVADVLNRFMGNIAEAWRAAARLKDLIQPTTPKVEDAFLTKVPAPDKNSEDQTLERNETIKSFKNFLRIMTTVFEENAQEEVVKKQLSLLRKEFLEPSTDPLSPASSVDAGGRSIFAKEIAKIPRKVREMIASELNSGDEEQEDVEPAFFVAAVRKVGEKLRDIYFEQEAENQDEKLESESCQPKKIYYRPPKSSTRDGTEESAMKSNLNNLAQKIGKICNEKKSQENIQEKLAFKNSICLDKQSSVYFDATDKVQSLSNIPRKVEFSYADSPEKVILSSVDESYFSLNASKFGKYRDLIYDKIITYLRSDNPRNIKYGMALLGRMMDKDGNPAAKVGKKVSEVKDEGENKWQNLLDKLLETCQVIETEMKVQVEKYTGAEHEEGENIEVGRMCEYLKGYVDKMKSLIEEMKSPERQCQADDSVQRIKALDNSRETNKERQLVTSGSEFPVRQKYFLDNALDLINSIGNIGYSFEKFPFYAKCFSGNTSENKTREIETFRREVTSELLLEGNKTIVKSLKKNIEKRQQKIEDLISEAGKEGASWKESIQNEKISRKVRDLKKCYLLLEKMICDPTLLPPRWLKMQESTNKKATPTKREESPVMMMLEDMMEQVTNEQRVNRYSESVTSADSKKTDLTSTASAGSVALVKINYAPVNLQYPALSKVNDGKKEIEEKENGVPLRPMTA